MKQLWNGELVYMIKYVVFIIKIIIIGVTSESYSLIAYDSLCYIS